MMAKLEAAKKVMKFAKENPKITEKAVDVAKKNPELAKKVVTAAVKKYHVIMKNKIVNDVDDIVQDMIASVLLDTDLALVAPGVIGDIHFIHDNVDVMKKVAVISGGGSGHEPAHAGFVGHGMLTGAVLGGVFASPAIDQVYQAICALADNSKGCLLIVKNYSGDRLNFGIAAELAKARNGINTEICIVADDVALLQKDGTVLGSIAGPRGLAGTLFVHKVSGWALNMCKKDGQYADLSEVLQWANWTAQNKSASFLYVIHLLYGHKVPGADEMQRTTDSEYELGLGIHGEPGCEVHKWTNCLDLSSKMIDKLVFGAKCKGIEITDVAVLINNLGGTSNLEMSVFTKDIVTMLQKKIPKIVIQRLYCGALMTSLNMHGVSVTILSLHLPRTNSVNIVYSERILEALDFKVRSPQWPQSINSITIPVQVLGTSTSGNNPIGSESLHKKQKLDNTQHIDTEINTDLPICKAIVAGCRALVASEKMLSELDSIQGDGDCGKSFKKGANWIIQCFTNTETFGKDIEQDIIDCTTTNTRKTYRTLLYTMRCLGNGFSQMGATSGAILCIFFRAIEADIIQQLKSGSVMKGLGCHLKAGIHAVTKYGGAKVGMKTMLDAIQPAVESFIKSLSKSMHEDSMNYESYINGCIITSSFGKEAIVKAAIACEEGAASTKDMEAMAGRASQSRSVHAGLRGIDSDVKKNVDIVDPGAKAVAIFIRAAYESLLSVLFFN